MKIISILLIIAAIICALLSEKIDVAVNGNRKVKRVILIFSVGVALLCTIALACLG